MKILVLSDSHGFDRSMRNAVLREQPDAVIHLGDHAEDARLLSSEFPRIPFCIVRGNCDFYDTSAPESVCADWDGVKIFAAHGHRYGVKSNVLRLYYAAMEQNAAVILYGHTHIPYCEESDGIWLLNPGSCKGSRPTYGIVTITNGIPQCEVRDAE